jgi:hypothetical protein
MSSPTSPIKCAASVTLQQIEISEAAVRAQPLLGDPYTARGDQKAPNTMTVTPRKIPTPADINAQQKRDAEATPRQQPPVPGTAVTPRAKPATPARPGTSVVPAAKPATPAPALPPNPEAVERHLAEWAGPGGRLLAFNGSTGVHRLLDDDTEVSPGQLFRAYLLEYRRGYIRFNPDTPPTVVMVGLGEKADLPARESLSDPDPRDWPISELTNQPDDPWKLQATFPIISCDGADELFIYVARGVVALNAVDGLLGRWRHHPKRKQGFVPIIQINNSTYYSKKFGCDRPKPEFRITGWVAEDAPPPEAPAQIAAPFNDEVPF